MGQRSQRLKNKRSFKHKPAKKPKKNEKQNPRKAGVVRRITNRIPSAAINF